MGRSQAFTTSVPTYLVGVEKRPRAEARWEKGEYLEHLAEPTRERHPGLTEFDVRKQRRRMAGYFNDSKVLVVTHIVKTESGLIADYLYNTYDPATPPRPQYMDGKVWVKEPAARQTVPAGLGALDDLESSLRSAIERDGHTHVLVMCMGWANDQEEAMLRYRMITDNLVAVAEERARAEGRASTFKPLVVAFSWPSQWWGAADTKTRRTIGHLFSYFNKTDDADELGLLIINRLVHGHLARAVPEEVPIVLIGHSLGARALSRAVYSDDLLKTRAENGRRPDLLVSLQPAYSARRWVSREGRLDLGSSGEGAPYLVAGERRNFITTSEHDTANPLALWAGHLGGHRGAKVAKKHPGLFTHATWEEATGLGYASGERPGEFTKPVLIDASSIVVEPGEHTVDSLGLMERSAHNDILDLQMARLIHHLITHETGAPAPTAR